MEYSCDKLQIEGDMMGKWVVQQNNMEPFQMEPLSYYCTLRAHVQKAGASSILMTALTQK